MQISDIIPGVNIIGRKVGIASINVSGGGGRVGVFQDPNRGFRGRSTLRKCLGSKEHLDWLTRDLNAAKIITVKDYEHKEKANVNGSTHYSVKAKNRTGNI